MIENPQESFRNLRDPEIGTAIVRKKLADLENDPKYLAEWFAFSEKSDSVYPDQGLLTTDYDALNYGEPRILSLEKVKETLRLRLYLLEMFNHPDRIASLQDADQKDFVPPTKISCRAIEHAISTGLSLSIGDLGAVPKGSQKERESRLKRYAEGPFIKLGKSARLIFTGSDSPDVWNTSAAISTMAASHCLATIPRNGIMVDTKRQSDLARESFRKLESLSNLILAGREDKEVVLGFWKKNIGGVLESSAEKALTRASALYEAGVRTFRVYSPEPGSDIVKTTNALRKEFGNEIEIFTGQIVDVDQAKQVEAAGANGIYVGIGGGGRCITGVRSGSVVDWPTLVWDLRGKINIPVIAEGGASDHIAVSLLLGASGIATSRVVAGGTIESPGGLLYFSDENGKFFKPYGGEASARTKFIEKKLLPFNLPSFVEGETTKAELNYVKHSQPTLTLNLHLLNEDAILAMVFRNTSNIYELHAIDPSPIRMNTSSGNFQRNTH